MPDDNKELVELLDALCDGTLSEEGAKRLGVLLQADANARQLYFDYVDIHVKLVKQAEQGQFSSLPDLENWLADSQRAMPLEVREATIHGVENAVRGGHGAAKRSPTRNYGYFLAAGLACLAFGVLFLFRSGPTERQAAEGADPSKQVSEDSQTAVSQKTSPQPYVAQILAMTDDVVWAEGQNSHEFLLRVKQGDLLQLESGLVKLRYFSGADLILRGPCSFEPTGYDSGRLNSGELTGNVTVGEFVLTTPTAKVVDLGTEFGVTVDSADNTDVRVFDGRVQVTAATGNGESEFASQLLTEGMSIRADRGGRFQDISGTAKSYARGLPATNPKSGDTIFSLVDGLSCDSQGRYRIASAIAPDTGDAYEQSTIETENAYPRQRHGTYHATRWHPLLDGVFIPTNQGLGVQSDSSGQVIDLVPNGANTSGPIFSRRRIKDTSRVVFAEHFWGVLTRKRVLERLQECELGMIGVHANVGITFDLDAIRQHCGRPIAGFETIVTNLDNSDENAPGPIGRVDKGRFIADFRAFVDGELRGSRLAFGRTDGDETIEFPITAKDRFLTLVSTDAGHYWYDQVVLIDPLLRLVPKE